jgi:hypothetical protein
VKQLGKMRKQNHYTRKTPPSRDGSPHTLEKSAWRIPSTRTTQSLTEGPRPTSHVAEALVSMHRRSKPPRTLPRRLEAAAEDILNIGGANRAPRARGARLNRHAWGPRASLPRRRARRLV